MRLLDSSLTVSPPADVRWEFDAFGNSIAVLSFHHAAQRLTVRSDLTVRRYGHDDPIGRLTRHTGPYPFAYDREESIDLAPLTALLFPDDRDALGAWLAAGIPTVPGETIALLDALVQAIHAGFAYSRRETAGVQSPAETIRLGSGTCRDFAVLFMEAARHLGFAARFVTGYVYDPSADDDGVRQADGTAVRGGGATHCLGGRVSCAAPDGWSSIRPTGSSPDVTSSASPPPATRRRRFRSAERSNAAMRAFSEWRCRSTWRELPEIRTADLRVDAAARPRNRNKPLPCTLNGQFHAAHLYRDHTPPHRSRHETALKTAVGGAHGKR